MLISSWFLSCILLLIQSVICSSVHDSPNAREESSKQLLTETSTYGYRHPPEPELYEGKGSRKGKSVNIQEQTASLNGKAQSRQVRRRPKPTPSLEIPVQVVYETEATTVGLNTKSKTTTSPLYKTTRVSVRRRKLKSNTNTNIDVRHIRSSTEKVDSVNVTENTQILTDKGKSDVSSTTEFPKRSRGSYFEKRKEPPAPKSKILEEKNFVFSHSGNFHYSYLGDDGTKISSEGSLKSFDNNKTGESVSGSVFYTDNEGNDYSLSYTADENGYRPVGAHLPTPPPIPPAIARALKYIADRSTQTPLTENE